MKNVGHYLATRMEKFKSMNLGGIQKHNQREFENHSNQDIDLTRGHLNYDLINQENISYRDVIMNTINEQREGTRKIRKDAVLVNEFFVTSGKAFFDGLEEQDQKNFFEAAKEWFSERYGEQNIAYATVHNDETTPHMHIGVVPMRDGKLQSKNIFNRVELLAVQKELPKYLENKGFDIKRGEEKSKNVHVQPEDWKKEQEVARQEVLRLRREKEEIASKIELERVREERAIYKVEGLKQEEEALERKTSGLKRYLEYSTHNDVEFSKAIGRKSDGTFAYHSVDRFVVIAREDYDSLNEIAHNASFVSSENRSLKKENEELKNEVTLLEKAQGQLKKTVDFARKRMDKVFEKLGIDGDGEKVFSRVMTYAKHFHKDKDPEVDSRVLDGLEETFDDAEGHEDYLEWKRERDKHLRAKERGR